MKTKLDYYLDVVSEECAEVIQRITKAKRFGLEETQQGHTDNNIERIKYEFIDLLTSFLILTEHDARFAINPDGADLMVERKAKKIQKYLDYSIKMGVTSGE